MSRTKSIDSIRPANQICHSRQLIAGVVCLIALAGWIRTGAVAGDPLRYHGGLRNSSGPKKLDDKKLQAVLKSLQEKTGFSEMGFDAQGFLTLGDRTKFSGGSATARALIAGAVEIRNAIDLESHNHSPLVAFARLATPTVFNSRLTGETINVNPIELDFSDFSKLRGDRHVIAAFDIGFVILHELGHAVLGLRDAVDDDDDPGECENYINRIRRELNLPERQNYRARVNSRNIISAQKTTQLAELYFALPSENQSRWKMNKLTLSWEAQLVGPIRPPAAPAIAKARNAKPDSTALNGQ